MLNLGNAITANEPEPEENVSLSDVLSSQLDFREAYQAFVDYKNVCEIVTKAKTSTEGLAFASELLNTSVENIDVSAEGLKQVFSNAWKKFVEMWKKFYDWIKSLIPKLIAAIKKLKKKKADDSSEGLTRQQFEKSPLVNGPGRAITFRGYEKTWENLVVPYKIDQMIAMSKLVDDCAKNKSKISAQAFHMNKNEMHKVKLKNDDDVCAWLETAKLLSSKVNNLIASANRATGEEREQEMYVYLRSFGMEIQSEIMRPVKDIASTIQFVYTHRNAK